MPAKEQIQEIFPLTSNQKSLLFHHLESEAGNDTGLIQVRAPINTALDLVAWENAWDELIRKIPSLRTTINWKNLKQPVQVVHKSGKIKIDYIDIRTEDQSTQDETIDKFLHEDSIEGLVLDQNPPMRFTLFHKNEDTFLYVWTCHHALLDGWSGALVINHLVKAYTAFHRGNNPDIPDLPSFKLYRDWISERPLSIEANQWKDILKDHVSTSTGSTFATLPETSKSIQNTSFNVNTSAAEALKNIILENGVTESLIITALWGLLMGTIKTMKTPLIGLTVNGRNAPIKNIENMVGMFANTIPFPMPSTTEKTFSQWLRKIQETQIRLQPFEHTQPFDIHQWLNLSPTDRIYDNLLIFANYPKGTDESNGTSYQGSYTSSFPITAFVDSFEKFQLNLIYNPNQFSNSWISDLGNAYLWLIDTLPISMDASMEEIQSKLRSKLQPYDPSIDSNAASVRQFELPQNQAEMHLVDLWERVLNQKDFGVTDNFFQLGGHSIAAANLISELEQRYQRNIPINILFEHPSVREFADYLESEPESDWPTVIRFKEGTTNPPIFFFHDLGSSVSWYQDLVKHLPPDQPVFAVQAPKEPLKTVEEMTNFYYQEIRKVHPDGPIHLSGYCFGGIIAYHMAATQREKGENIGAVITIDLVFSKLFRYSPQYLLNLLRNNGLIFATKKILNRLKVVLSRIQKTLFSNRKGLKSEAEDYMDTSKFSESLKETVNNYFQVNQNYSPITYKGDITVIVSNSDYLESVPLLGWDRIVSGQIKIEPVDANHHTIMKEPHVRETAKIVTQTINNWSQKR